MPCSSRDLEINLRPECPCVADDVPPDTANVGKFDWIPVRFVCICREYEVEHIVGKSVDWWLHSASCRSSMGGSSWEKRPIRALELVGVVS